MTGDLHNQLSPAAPLTVEEKELFAWLKLNRENFEIPGKYDTWEIAKLAIDNGFTESMVYNHISSIKSTMLGQRIENIIAQKMYLFDFSVEVREELSRKLNVKKIDLSMQWKRTAWRERTGREFRKAA